MNDDLYKKLHGFYVEDLKLGQEAFLSKTITEADIVNFSGVTGDTNPVHLSDEFAKKTIFKKKVAHGFLTASFISTLIATKLPGPGSIYLGQSLKFLAPVFVGDTLTVKVKIKNIDLETKKVLILTECFKLDKKVLTGEAEILVDSKK